MKIGLFLYHIYYIFFTKRKVQSESFLAFNICFLKQTKKKLHIVLAKLKNTPSVFLAYVMYPIFHWMTSFFKEKKSGNY